jgi:altronate hydrolase
VHAGNDVESTSAEVGAGANIVLFTTGLGTPTGNPVAPVVKISSNTALYRRMPDIIDINTGTIIEGEETIQQAGERILEYVISVASGETECAAVRHGQNDFYSMEERSEFVGVILSLSKDARSRRIFMYQKFCA